MNVNQGIDRICEKIRFFRWKNYCRNHAEREAALWQLTDCKLEFIRDTFFLTGKYPNGQNCLMKWQFNGNIYQTILPPSETGKLIAEAARRAADKELIKQGFAIVLAIVYMVLAAVAVWERILEYWGI